MSINHHQTPIAIIGLACRLPGNSNSPEEFWKLLLDGRIADTTPPPSRFSLKGHYDGTLRPWTMRSPGGMFLNVDPKDIDAGFFGLSQVDAISMDPQQRQLLEVVYEGLENAGLPLEEIKSKLFGCFVGSYASDYSDIQTRDPEDRTPSFTVGSGRAMLSNRISHFLDVKGPSMTVDTACSGSLISLDLACRYLDSGDADGAIVAGCNLYMSPEHNMDQHAMTSAASPSGRCWTFDARADGYIKAEAINCLILKRLDDALRSGDPIRAVIRGTSTNSDGWTPGIASPSADAQALAIRRAYARAGITAFNDTTYLECHGTGTLAGDPIECRAASSVFSSTRPEDSPLRIGSVKSNLGHSEPAAGISGMLKTVLAIERGIIPGNPTFERPNPNIDFDALKILPSKPASAWPQGLLRRASVNSFGYGGSNAHAIVEHPNILLPDFESTGITSYTETDNIFADDEQDDIARRLLIFSANDETSLRASIKECRRHLANPAVKVQSADLAYTLAQRRTRHFYRAYAISDGPTFHENQVVYGKLGSAPRIGFVFTGQGAQWPQMGQALVRQFRVAKETIQHLDDTLQSLSEAAPSWSLMSELSDLRSAEHMRLPEFSQPLVTALQLAIIAVLKDWGVEPGMVVGHSSGEIAAAVAAGYLSQDDGIKVAYLRGKAAKDMQPSSPAKLGMLAAGLSRYDSQPYLACFPEVSIACSNSPNSVTLSGPLEALDCLQEKVKADGHFARLLLVDLAYHSKYMEHIAGHYRNLLARHCPDLLLHRGHTGVSFYSTVYGKLWQQGTGVAYWVENMTSPVLFEQGVTAMVENGGADYLVEVGPSGALAGPIQQIKHALGEVGGSATYSPTLKRGNDSTRPLYDLAGKMFFSGIAVDLNKVSDIDSRTRPRVIVDLPNYQWNHSVKYWHESLASKDWRFRPFPVHDLLGSKVLGTSWNAPTWRRTLRLRDVPWIRDHNIGTDVVFPASGYVAMAVEAMFQAAKASDMEIISNVDEISQASYSLRDIRLLRALVVEEDAEHHLYLFLNPAQGQKDTWFHFKISSLHGDSWTEHCTGCVRISQATMASEKGRASHEPLKYPTPASLWYKSMQNVGFNFGPTFQNLSQIESTAGQRTSRARIQFPDTFTQSTQSKYTIHPSVFDTFFQAGIPSLYEGHRTSIEVALVPWMIDEIVICSGAEAPKSALAVTSSAFVTGRPDQVQNYKSSAEIYGEASGSLISKIEGIHYKELPIPEAKERSHTFMRTCWKADISLFQNGTDLDKLVSSDHEVSVLSNRLRLTPAAAYLMSLLKHKVAVPSVLDLDMMMEAQGQAEKSEIALNQQISGFRRYVYASKHTDHVMAAEHLLQNFPGAEFHIFDPESTGTPPFEMENKFDMVVLRMPADGNLVASLAWAREFCAPNGFLVLLHQATTLNDESEPGVTSFGKFQELQSIFLSTRLSMRAKSSLEYVSTGTCLATYLCSPQLPDKETLDIEKDMAWPLVDLSKGTSEECLAVVDSLGSFGWTGSRIDLSTASTQPSSTPLLLVDNPQSPLLANIAEPDWGQLIKLVTAGRRLMWLTLGMQSSLSPSNALIQGFARSLRSEEPTLVLKTLHLTTSPNDVPDAQSVLQVMETLIQEADDAIAAAMSATENEYHEHDGVLYICRVVPDHDIIKAAEESNIGGPLEEKSLRKNERTVRAYCERIGAMDSIYFNEVAGPVCPLGEGEVEVDIRAAGLNYKDIATTLGLVPENEHLLGLEAAGVITQVGSGVGSYRIGDRVLVHGKGSFANRNRVPKENVFLLPAWLSYEEAATMSIVYFTAVYSLMEIVQIKKGQSILIHSAAGGVGLASIQVCRYLGAEVYATAGNPEKKRFLAKHFEIPPERIFSSRNSDFAGGIRSLTNGRGVDFVLNFLTGDLLDQSWRLLADNGTMLEIGKKDIVDKNQLSMEPFDRNCSYHGIDISRASILGDLPLIEKVLQRIRSLLIGGHIKPISPMSVFSFSKISEAMRYMRSGEHMGKIVISSSDTYDIKVPIRRLPQSLSFDARAAYLIVGGLKGLCGSLAVYMARCGARNLIIMSRGSTENERSHRVTRDLASLGATVRIFKGDVKSLQDVTRVFQESPLPIKGLIQGAMVLRDKTFESMTPQEYHEALACKVTGTWNLHSAAEHMHHKLDFFTMLSSISGIVGTAGQANYAAGNTFQDAFALYRRSLGLAAHTINLGIVEDVGYMSEHEELTERVQSRSQLPGINERQLHDILKFSILQQTLGVHLGSASQMITGLPYPLPEDSPVLRDMRFHSLLVPQHSQDGVAGDRNGDDGEFRAFQAALEAKLPIERLLTNAIKLVNKQIVRILGLSSDMEETKPLNSYGLDSLAAVDLRNWFKIRLRVELTTLDILNADSLKVLCMKAIGCLRDAHK